ncbi:MAG: hypothetical protein MI749_00895 [Desulfovibrionales bacterium]|nr:hypothetical protein [Desulfovibrionales bacterium]
MITFNRYMSVLQRASETQRNVEPAWHGLRATSKGVSEEKQQAVLDKLLDATKTIKTRLPKPMVKALARGIFSGAQRVGIDECKELLIRLHEKDPTVSLPKKYFADDTTPRATGANIDKAELEMLLADASKPKPPYEAVSTEYSEFLDQNDTYSPAVVTTLIEGKANDLIAKSPANEAKTLLNIFNGKTGLGELQDVSPEARQYYEMHTTATNYLHNKLLALKEEIAVVGKQTGKEAAKTLRNLNFELTECSRDYRQIEVNTTKVLKQAMQAPSAPEPATSEPPAEEAPPATASAAEGTSIELPEAPGSGTATHIAELAPLDTFLKWINTKPIPALSTKEAITIQDEVRDYVSVIKKRAGHGDHMPLPEIQKALEHPVLNNLESLASSLETFDNQLKLQHGADRVLSQDYQLVVAHKSLVSALQSLQSALKDELATTS